MSQKRWWLKDGVSFVKNGAKCGFIHFSFFVVVGMSVMMMPMITDDDGSRNLLFGWLLLLEKMEVIIIFFLVKANSLTFAIKSIRSTNNFFPFLAISHLLLFHLSTRWKKYNVKKGNTHAHRWNVSNFYLLLWWWWCSRDVFFSTKKQKKML